MTDRDLDELIMEWRSIAPPADLECRLRRHRLAMRRSVALGFASVAILIACLYWVVQQALADGGTERWLIAAAFAAAVPVTLYTAIKFRREATLSFDLSPIGCLHRDRARLETIRHLIFSGRASAIILVLASAAVGLMSLAGAVDSTRTMLPAGAWVLTAAALWLWQRNRTRTLALEVAAVEEMIYQFMEAADADIA